MNTPLRLFSVLALVAATLPFALRADARGRVEIVLVLALLVAVVRFLLPRLGFANWSPGERAVVLTLLVATLIGQLVGDARWTFPFVRWEMYGARPDVTAPVTWYEQRGASTGRPERVVSLREAFGECGFRVEAALRDVSIAATDGDEAAKRLLLDASLVIFRLVIERSGESFDRLRRVRLERPIESEATVETEVYGPVERRTP